MPRIKIIKTPKNLNKFLVGGQEDCPNGYVWNEFAQQCVPDPNLNNFNQDAFENQNISGVGETTSTVNNSNTPNAFNFQPTQQGFGTGVQSNVAPKDPRAYAPNKQLTFGQKLKGFGNTLAGGIGKAGQAVNNVLYNPYVQLGMAGLNYYQNKQSEKEAKRYELQASLPENYLTVDTTKNRGDYDQYGMYNPQATGYKSKGTQANAYYPQQNFAEYGGMIQAEDGISIPYVGDVFVPSTYVAAPNIVNPNLPAAPTVPVPSNEPPAKSSKSSGANPMAKQTWEEYSKQFGGLKNLGIWGDEKHKKTKSDHNTGDALDIGITDANQGSEIAQRLINEANDRNIKYIIWNKKIWNPSISNEWRPYTGPNPHSTHVHVSFNRNEEITNNKGNQISFTHNNPLNVHYGDFASQYGAEPGASDSDGKVAKFTDLQTGIQANKDLLFGPKYANLTISQARNKWVTGNPNKFTQSTNNIVTAMGGDKKLSDLTPIEKDRLFKEFAKWEGKQAYNLIKDRRIFNNGGQNNNSMKIRIVGTPDENPEMAYGGQPPYSGQTDYGLYIGQRNLYKTMAKHPYKDISNTVSEEEETPEDPYVLEAEGGETIKRPDGSHENIEGDRHTTGGVKLKKSQAPEGSFIYSDTAKMKLTEQEAKRFGKSGNKKHTPAAVAKQYNTNMYRAMLADPNTDSLQKNTAKRMLDAYDQKLAELALVQESKKGFPQGIPDVAKQFFEKMTGQSSSQQQPQEMSARYGGAYKHGGMHGRPGTYADGYSGTYSNGVYFNYGGALKRFQGDEDGSTVGVPYADAPAYTGGADLNDLTGLNKAASRKYTLPSWLELWTKANTAQGAKSPAHGYPSTYDPKVGNQIYDDYEYWRDRYGKDFEGATDKEKQYNYQKFVFDELQKGNPSAINYITETWGPTINSGKKTITDDPKNPYYGARMAFAANSRIPIPQTPPGTTDTPPETKTPPAIITPPLEIPPPGTTKINPNEYNSSGKSNIPWQFTQQDINNINSSLFNLANLKRYSMASRPVTPTLPQFIPVDWRGQAAALQSAAARERELLGIYQPGQAQGAAGSAITGQLAERLAGAISGTDQWNAAGAAQTDAQRAQILNQFSQYNAALRDSDRKSNIEMDSAYRKAYSKGVDRLTGAWNQGITNRAGIYATNLSESPDYFYNPRDQRMTFNNANAYYNYMNKMQGGYKDDSQNSQIAIYNDAYDKARGTPAEKHAAALEAMKLQGNMGKTTTRRYPANPYKNMVSTTMPGTMGTYNPFDQD